MWLCAVVAGLFGAVISNFLQNFLQMSPITQTPSINAVFFTEGRKHVETMKEVIIIFVITYRTLVFRSKTSFKLLSNFLQRH